MNGTLTGTNTTSLDGPEINDNGGVTSEFSVLYSVRPPSTPEAVKCPI